MTDDLDTTGRLPAVRGSMRVRPCDITTARLGCARVHRHRRLAPPSGLAAFEVVADGWPVGWALVGRPASPVLQARGWVEVTRCAVEEGRPNACSMLYGAAWRWARKRLLPLTTYTLTTESGASLRGAGWVPVANIATRTGSGWNNRPGRQATDRAAKVRWCPPEVALGLAWERIAERYLADRHPGKRKKREGCPSRFSPLPPSPTDHGGPRCTTPRGDRLPPGGSRS